MSLMLHNISKSYGSHTVLDNISLTFKRGEIVGLVGINGVGKTTLLKIIAGLINQYEGSISGTTTIGYLSEQNPLYPQMYVTEYLSWINSLNKSERTWDLDDLIQQVGIREVASKKIKTLSKGYRQRVGLAAALIHQPQLLLLDEPINGLDPVQIREYHQLIRGIRKDRIIILSSHLLQEIKALCDRVLKLENGGIVTDSYLTEHISSQFSIQVKFEKRIDIEHLKLLKSIHSVEAKGQGEFIIHGVSDRDLRKDIFDLAVAQNNRLFEITDNQDQLGKLFK